MSADLNFSDAPHGQNQTDGAATSDKTTEGREARGSSLSNQAWDAAAQRSAERKPAASEEPSSTWIQFGGISHHAQRHRGFNEQNWGIGIEHKLSRDNPIAIGDDSSIAVGMYRNSIRQTSNYAFYQWKPLHVGPVDIGVMVGVVDGYKLRDGKPIPAVLPTASIEGKHLGVNFMCVPQMKEISAVCAMQFKVRY